jgi:hypothetical protein
MKESPMAVSVQQMTRRIIPAPTRKISFIDLKFLHFTLCLGSAQGGKGMLSRQLRLPKNPKFCAKYSFSWVSFYRFTKRVPIDHGRQYRKVMADHRLIYSSIIYTITGSESNGIVFHVQP